MMRVGDEPKAVPRPVMVIPLKKVKEVCPKDIHHPINWHFDKPIVPDAKQKSARVKRLSSTGYLKRGFKNKAPSEEVIDPQANSN